MDLDGRNIKAILPKEHQFKVLVVGEYGVGKTAIIRRYTEGAFSSNYKVTIGVDFAVKNLQWDSLTKVNLQLWDIAGHERFGSMTRVYYKYALAAIIVFDLSRPQSLQTVPKWLLDVREKVVAYSGYQIPIILLANKCDAGQFSVKPEIINEFCLNNNIEKWLLTSAKENINIDNAMNWVVKNILEARRNVCENSSVIILPEPDESPKTGCCK